MNNPDEISHSSSAAPPSIALALGGGSARGLAHILMLEAFDELGVKPRAIVGTSIGSMVGSLYCTGMTGAEIRAFVEEMLASRTEVFRRLGRSRDGLRNLWTFRAPSVVDGVTLFELLLPQLRCNFTDLKVPFTAMAVDYYRMAPVALDSGPLIPAVAASCSLPTILRPVQIGGRILVDGGFCNPCPFDVAAGKADRVVAVDVTGITSHGDETAAPNPIEAWIGCTQIMFHALNAGHMATTPPDLMIRPAVGNFGTMDFARYREIFAVSEPAKDEMKRGLERLMTS